MHQQLKFIIWFSAIIVAVFVVAWLWIRESSEPGPYDLEPVNVVRNHATNSDVADWQTYRNEKYGFEIKYPKGKEVRDFTTRNKPHYPQLLLMIGFCESDIGVDCVGGLVHIFKGEQSWDDKWAKTIYKNSFTYIISGEEQIIPTFRFLQ